MSTLRVEQPCQSNRCTSLSLSIPFYNRASKARFQKRQYFSIDWCTASNHESDSSSKHHLELVKDQLIIIRVRVVSNIPQFLIQTQFS
jgi:hypothetical protein